MYIGSSCLYGKKPALVREAGFLYYEICETQQQ